METITPQSILLLLALFQIKHALCDGPFQTIRMVKEKGYYGKLGGIQHATIHGWGSFVALFLFGVPLVTSLVLAAIDTVIHYHVDFIKESLVRLKRWTLDKSAFWWALMIDQLMHQLTYLALASVVIRLAN
jgi:hypothetical protein